MSASLGMQYDCFTPEELDSMTLQVGLVGSDGIVIASDRRLTRLAAAVPESSDSAIDKILEGDGVCCCWAGDGASERAANLVAGHVWETQDYRRELNRLGNEAWRIHWGANVPNVPIANQAAIRTVLVAVSDGTLWELQVNWDSVARRIHDKVLAGDVKTTTSHILKHFIPSPAVSVSQLIPVAAHIILMGAKENSLGVGGLQIAVVPRDEKCFLLPESKIDELKSLSEEMLAAMSRVLIRDFDYRPVTPRSS